MERVIEENFVNLSKQCPKDRGKLAGSISELTGDNPVVVSHEAKKGNLLYVVGNFRKVSRLPNLIGNFYKVGSSKGSYPQEAYDRISKRRDIAA
jgi:hypothetical protein